MKRNSRSADAPATAAEVADLERAAQVRLRPVFGIPPGAYLTVIYGLALALALFLALLYPGLRAPGGRLEVTATPRNVTVSLDGKFAGTTPLALDASPGVHELELARAGFAAERLRVEVVPRVFGTLIVRNRTAAHADLELIDGTAVARRHVAEFAAAPHVIGIIGDAGRALARAEPADRYAFLRDVLPFIDRRQALGALVRAAAGGGPVTPQTMRSLFDRFLQLDRDYPGLPSWLAATVPDRLRERLAAQRWHAEHGERYRQALGSRSTLEPPARRPPTGPSDAVVVGGLRFRPVPGGTLLMGDDIGGGLAAAHDRQPHLRAVAPFLMAETEVTNRQFARFAAEVPRWAPDATARLVREGLAEPTYLASWSGGAPASDALDDPVTHVSYHAAAAFAAWLDATMASGTGAPIGEAPDEELVVRLPTEAEWEWAARGGLAGRPYPLGADTGGARLAGLRGAGPGPAPTSEPNGYGLYDLLGNVWEWTATWYAPASYLLWADADPVPAAAGQPRVGAERVVRGGSWASRRELISVHSRGAQEPAWATPYLGFRVVIAAPQASDG